MKKFVALLFSFALLCAFAVPALAADATHLMTHGDDYQDALLVGKILEATDDDILFDVVRTVNGIPAKSPFRLEKGGYFDPRLEFAAGDGILASVQFTPGSKKAGTVAYRALKVELKQDKKIKMDVSDYDAGFLEWYVNTGENDLYSDGGSIYRHNFDGGGGELLFDGELWHVDSLDPKYKAPQARLVPIRSLLSGIPMANVLMPAFAGLAAVEFAVIVILVALLARKKRKMKSA